MSNVNTAWKNDLYPLIEQTFDYQYENFMNIIKQVVEEDDNKAIDYRLEGLGGYGELPDYDGSQLIGMNQKRGFVTIINPKEKAGAIDIQRRYANVDKSGEAKKAGTRAAYSVAMTVYLAALRMFGRALNGSYLGGDGKTWAATDHPVASKGDANGNSIADPDAGTFSNLITQTLSVSAITAAQTMANRFVTPDGLPFKCDMSGNGLLLVSPELEPKAKEICGPNSKLIPEKLPESAENGANPIYGLQYIVIGGGADGFTAKQWAICDKTLLPQVAKIVYVERPTVLRANLDNPLIARIVPYADFGVGFGDARPIIFSNP
ncbi:hypothetical protein A7D23_05975 [Dehalobacter sp. TeCB1]|nr:hypothetical protein A7D23_05975 [Dehalobacter sp. TeCB1]